MAVQLKGLVKARGTVKRHNRVISRRGLRWQELSVAQARVEDINQRSTPGNSTYALSKFQTDVNINLVTLNAKG